MKTSDTQKQPGEKQRKIRLSPELQEFLHMLSSLEAEMENKAAATR